MGAGGIPSGGITKRFGRIGSLPRFGAKPNSRIDLYNYEGKRIQSRWYDANGIAFRNRDYNHGGQCDFPHDHTWSAYRETYIDENGNIAAYIFRSEEHEAPDFFHYPA
ncbi:MAG: hypothetical protein HFK10_00615 [Clostridia bacterium]|jgi:hypothetical protein|nr:hypothetical protein [Clostridia bacterium]